MKRVRSRLRGMVQDLRPLAMPVLLSVIIYVFSLLLFVYVYRNDMLIFASLRKNPALIKALVAVGARAASPTEIFPEPALIEYLHTFFSDTPRQESDPTVVDALISAGASVTERNENGWTPLMLAAAAGLKGAVESLLKAGAEVDARAFGDTSEGMTALMAAAMHGHAEVTQVLVDKGANVHLRSRSGFTALLLAASRGHLDCVEALLRKGASVPLSTVQVAERNGHSMVASRLKEAMKQPRGETLSRRPAKFPEE